MNNNLSVMTYRFALLCFLLLQLSNGIYAQEKVKASDAFQQGDYLVIKVVLPTSNAPCFSIQQVELVDLTTKTKIVAKSLEGSLKNLPAGNQQFLWNYKKDNIFLDSNYDLFVYLDACPPINVEPMPIITKEEPKEKKIESGKPSSRIALKLLVGGTGIITAIMANSIKSSFNSKVATLTTLNNTLTQVNGQFTSQTDLDTWNTAYANAKSAQQTGLLNALIATSVLSLAYEVYLLASKPKKMTTTRKMSLSPSSDYTYNTGLSLTYHF
ncbi:MAG: hypothetical protein QE277_00305 [Flectobacillus sp.]|nr:hypothetical protein [Flectobacillus sp.]